MKYPIGIQTFANIRNDGYCYVDKTALVYKLANEGGFYFLSRPRRFGKSLLMSTLRSYFEGDSKLFEGLAMERLETEWKRHAVIYFDFNTVERGRPESLDELLNDRLSRYERQYGVTDIAGNYALRLGNIIHSAYERTQRRVVVLIDEYDKPMLNLMENNEPVDAVRDKMKAFYSVLKGEDRYIRFAMLTGVTRFSKVSVFSDLNNLTDISMSRKYATLCGITADELRENFDEQIGELAEENGMSRGECYKEMERRYDGYHFANKTVGMYNPFSVLNTLAAGEFSSYWFATGTPTYLVDVIRRTNFDFERGLKEPIEESLLSDVDTVEYSPVPILFQSGYLTITGYDNEFHTYTLDFPNAEVREGFTKYLLPKFTPSGENSLRAATNLVRAVRTGDTDAIATLLKDLFDQRGNCMLYTEASKERDFRNIVYMLFSFLDIYCSAELCTAAGRMDISIETKDYVYVIELKLDKSAEAALRQIKDKGYADRFRGDKRQLILMGVNFSTKTNSIDDWATERGLKD